MKRIKRVYEYPKGTPRKLIMMFRKAKQNERELGRMLKVNVFYVSKALKLGERPSNNDIAVKLFFSSHPICKCCKRKIINRKHSEKMVEPDYIRKWKHLSTSERRTVILLYIAEKEESK